MSGREPDWIPEDEVQGIHDREIGRFGGLLGLRSPDGLASALVRPLNRFHYEGERSLPRLAAVYAAAVIRNHPYVDGNKRAGWALAETFLKRNKMAVVAPDGEIFDNLVRLASRKMSEDDFADWLESRSHPTRSRPSRSD